MLQKISKVDREIAKAESQIAKLKKKQVREPNFFQLIFLLLMIIAVSVAKLCWREKNIFSLKIFQLNDKTILDGVGGCGQQAEHGL